MEASQLDPVHRHQTRPEEPELDLYTIPRQSSWFVWDEIHETERVSLREFFNGSSISRTPKIYKEYRDFIINKYREEPSRKLSFTEVRKSLVGDVNLLRKTFVFLENWGLINFSASPAVAGDGGGEREEEGRCRVRVRVEEGVPSGIRVAAMPDSMKPIAVLPESKKDDPASGTGGVGGGVGKSLPLASYSDVFAGVFRREEVAVCGNCGDHCDSKRYEYSKEGDFSICVKCFESGNYGENKTIDDYKFVEGVEDGRKSGTVWSEAETLLLLESVLKYGDDWELVARNLPTKTKLDCIAKLIELPLGDVLGGATTSLRATSDNNTSNDHTTGNSNSSAQDQPEPTFDNQETVEIGEQNDKKVSEGDMKTSEAEQNGDLVELDPPLKRQRIGSFSGHGGSLMEQVSRIATMVEPHIAAAAADAAITSLCNENSWPREIFDDDDVEEEDFETNGLHTSIADSETERTMEGEGSDMDRGPTQPGSQNKSTKQGENDLPLTLRIRTAVATALGAAAARAKLLADQEEREIEHLVATIVRTEVKKLQCKVKHFDDLEAIMKKKHAEMEEIEDVLLAERIEVLQAAFKAGVSGWKNHSSVNS